MKKITVLIICNLIIFIATAGTTLHNPVPKLVNANTIIIPLPNGNAISLNKLSRISRSDLEEQCGNKINFLQRIACKKTQSILKHSISEDGSITNEKLNKAFTDENYPFHGGGFALGVFLGIIGVFIAYFINDDKKKARFKWANIGFLVHLLIILIIIGAILASVNYG